METKNNLIVDLTFSFALKIIEYTESLETKRKYIMANQLYRCRTSIGSNVKEAHSAESKADFIHKMKIADKEAEETQYRLELCKHAVNYPECNQLIDNLITIKKIIGKIISSSKK
jgi:four helix bundle protein